MPDLARLHETWESLGQTDPLWAILSTEETRGNHWDLATFFQTGEEEVERLFYLLRGLDISFGRGRALDFGCGVGRVTQALATRFDSVDGVDIAASMIRRASEYNRHQDRCTYHVNASSDLRLFNTSTFDVVYSRIVLMHIPRALSERYISELARTLRPGGLAVLHVPSSLKPVRRVIYEAAVMRRRCASAISSFIHPGHRLAVASTGGASSQSEPYKHAMYFIPKARAERLLRKSGMEVICTSECETDGVHDVTYFARKRT
jgi:SAM-dependent methyltransferase